MFVIMARVHVCQYNKQKAEEGIMLYRSSSIITSMTSTIGPNIGLTETLHSAFLRFVYSKGNINEAVTIDNISFWFINDNSQEWSTKPTKKGRNKQNKTT